MRHDNGRPDSSGGLLCVYPERHPESLQAIRATPDRGGYAIRPCIGQTIVILGGIVPHKVLPVDEHQERIISVLCYQMVMAT